MLAHRSPIGPQPPLPALFSLLNLPLTCPAHLSTITSHHTVVCVISESHRGCTDEAEKILWFLFIKCDKFIKKKKSVIIRSIWLKWKDWKLIALEKSLKIKTIMLTYVKWAFLVSKNTLLNLAIITLTFWLIAELTVSMSKETWFISRLMALEIHPLDWSSDQCFTRHTDCNRHESYITASHHNFLNQVG